MYKTKDKIVADNLVIGYRGKVIAGPLNISLQGGDVTAIIGRNGIGKSTLIKTLTANIKPLGGNIYLDGEDLGTYNRNSLAKKIAILFPGSGTVGGLKVRELVNIGRYPFIGLLGKLSKQDHELVSKALERVGIIELQDRMVGELSDGERQKVLIARALVQDTPIIIMDEPFSFLDVASRLEILTLVKSIARSENKAIVFSTHDISQALNLSDKIILFLDKGLSAIPEIITGDTESLIAEGVLDKMFNNPNIYFDKIKRDFFYNAK